MSARARKINRLVFVVFVAASAFALWRALIPGDDTVGLIPWDKAKHFIVFYVLSILASLALPQSRLHRIGLVLLAFGGAIEILQGFVGRDASWFDLFADACGISAAFGPMLVSKWWRAEARF
ncbi:MAG: VanZ family protein [Caulobacter sp.]|nr:VanZ family protein [Caulobacter sp.]